MYVSSHSADVILSDIRPVKLAPDALGCLNATLDEILQNVILAAHSLHTDRLKAGLNRVLPTPLGKEALLEAELELRAYWERMKAVVPPPAQSAQPDPHFHVQWAIEVRVSLTVCVRRPLTWVAVSSCVSNARPTRRSTTLTRTPVQSAGCPNASVTQSQPHLPHSSPPRRCT
jgi:hypothetical protein